MEIGELTKQMLNNGFASPADIVYLKYALDNSANIVLLGYGEHRDRTSALIIDLIGENIEPRIYSKEDDLIQLVEADIWSYRAARVNLDSMNKEVFNCFLRLTEYQKGIVIGESSCNSIQSFVNSLERMDIDKKNLINTHIYVTHDKDHKNLGNIIELVGVDAESSQLITFTTLCWDDAHKQKKFWAGVEGSQLIQKMASKRGKEVKEIKNEFNELVSNIKTQMK